MVTECTCWPICNRYSRGGAYCSGRSLRITRLQRSNRNHARVPLLCATSLMMLVTSVQCSGIGGAVFALSLMTCYLIWIFTAARGVSTKMVLTTKSTHRSDASKTNGESVTRGIRRSWSKPAHCWGTLWKHWSFRTIKNDIKKYVNSQVWTLSNEQLKQVDRWRTSPDSVGQMTSINPV